MTYRSGELDQRIKFQKRENTPDGMGGSSFEWVDIDTLADVWAHVRQKSGREVTEYDRVNAVASYIFVIRHRSDILPAYRIVWNGSFFNITNPPLQKGRSLYMEIQADYGEAQ